MTTPRIRGMTLIEVLAVIALLGLVAGTLAVSFSGSLSKGRHDLARTQLALIASRIEAYFLAFSAYPPPEPGLALLSDGHARPSDAYYLPPARLLDPWQRPYALLIPGPDDHPYEIITLGADGAPGGDGPDADLSTVTMQRRSEP